MGLSDRLGARAIGRAHVLAVEVPGWWVARAEVERAAVARGWRLAMSPADADVLVVCGPLGEALAAAVDRVWQQVPGPRARVEVDSPDAAAATAALGRAADVLRTTGATDTAPDHEGMDQGGMDHGDMDHGDMDHGDMDHGDMDMSPAGIPLAGGGDDRDGLEMDVLTVPLGPVLACWPGGLVLRCELHGDTVARAEVEQLPAAGPAPRDGGSTAARRYDAASALLALAGWDDAAAAGRRLRDRVLAGEQPVDVDAAGERLHHRVARSRTLRWALPGEVRDRLLAMLHASTRVEPVDGARHALPELVAGLDLATVRLVVASLALDLSLPGARAASDA